MRESGLTLKEGGGLQLERSSGEGNIKIGFIRISLQGTRTGTRTETHAFSKSGFQNSGGPVVQKGEGQSKEAIWNSLVGLQRGKDWGGM